ncbi:MAG: CvpA family protein [Candidatus Atribacteria bacterium]|nr:MAG: CvpA family protein [Candidatus Atribacteria bacterium]
MATINWIDVSIMIIILLNMIVGIRRGILRGIINLIGVITAIFLAIFWFKEVGEYISSHSQLSREIANILGFALIFLGIYLIARIIEIFLKKIFSLLFVSWIDGLGGALFGLTKGSLIVGILLVIISFIPLPVFLKEQLESSFLANRFAVMTTIVYDYLKDWLPLSIQFNTEEFLEKFHLNLIVLKDTAKYFISI